MSIQNSTLIGKVARELNLEVCRVPFYAADGIELRKQVDRKGNLTCVGCICGFDETEIYRRVDNKRDIFFRTNLWFLWNWLIKPRITENHYKTVRVVASRDFNEQIFVEVVKNEMN